MSTGRTTQTVGGDRVYFILALLIAFTLGTSLGFAIGLAGFLGSVVATGIWILAMWWARSKTP